MEFHRQPKLIGQLIGVLVMIVFVVSALVFDLQPRRWPPIARLSIFVAAVIITSLGSWHIIRRPK